MNWRKLFRDTLGPGYKENGWRGKLAAAANTEILAEAGDVRGASGSRHKNALHGRVPAGSLSCVPAFPGGRPGSLCGLWRRDVGGIQTRGMLEPLRQKSEADILQEIAHPLPVRVIAEMLGVPETLHEHFIQWSDALAIMMGNPRRTLEQTRLAQEAVLALTAFFRAAVAERRRQKGSDLISLLLDIEEDGDVLTEEELYAQCVMLLFGGHETTRNLIGNGIYTLLRHPAEMAELRESPEIIRTAVEELLRYESPVQYTGRTAKEDMEVCGAALHQGQQILFMLGAANRDPQQFKEPDQLNLKRLNNPHLAFGAGAHFCIGNQLARLEGQLAILKMVQQFPRMQLASPRLEWAANFGFRGLKTLPVVL